MFNTTSLPPFLREGGFDESGIDESGYSDMDVDGIQTTAPQDRHTIARFEYLQDDQNIRRPTRTNADTDDISPDRLTNENLGDIVAFVYSHFTDIQSVYPEFIWDATSNRWEQMHMPDQILEKDGDNWHMYNDSVSAGQVTLSYENLPNNLPPVPSTY